ncbi:MULTISPECIES: preprotein translocase subunit SecG [Mucilaginibacter]|uniref:Protein-export membrane protein SecG n=1 Tax=Mucilaginibacter rubeus TaxID=2027860 RepID=A0A5C1I4I9_9SPHI|nr:MULTISPECIES: preprotein translocase subunit SecG [Mucilaginibacter]QEM12240.1 preprotein translocase subunit SecG [Mucilaginibacter rubeus]
MYIVLIIVTVIVCALLGLIVLIQNPKGGGLASNFSSSSQLMGVQKTGDFLEKGTWVLAITLMVLSLAINVAVKGGSSSSNNDNPALREQIEKASKPTNSVPSATPALTPSATPAPKPADSSKK